MSIIYALVARHEGDPEYGGNVHVLAEASSNLTGNFPQITRELILKNVPVGKKSLYKYEDPYVFHTLNQEGFTYLCLVDGTFATNRIHVFLEEVRLAFYNQIPPEKRDTAITYGLSGFAETLQKKMDYYNQNKTDPKLARIRDNINSTMGVMEQNLDGILERGEKIQLLVRKAETLNIASDSLKQRSTQLREQARNEALKRALLIGGGVLVLVYFVFLD